VCVWCVGVGYCVIGVVYESGSRNFYSCSYQCIHLKNLLIHFTLAGCSPCDVHNNVCMYNVVSRYSVS